MPPSFEIDLIYRPDPTKFEGMQINKCQGTSLTEVLSKFLLIVKNVQEELDKKSLEEIKKQLREDDDIPF